MDYRGHLRARGGRPARAAARRDATFRVVKNSLTERAADRAGAETLQAAAGGPDRLHVRATATPPTRGQGDLPTSRARTDALAFKGGLMDGQELTAEQVGAISRLPAREVLHAQLVGTVAAPVTGLVRGLAALIGGVARQLQQIQTRGW